MPTNDDHLEDLALDEAVEDEYRLPCGCYEYHTADCPRLTERFAADEPPPFDLDYDLGY